MRPQTAAANPRRATPPPIIRGQRPDDPAPSERQPESKAPPLALPPPEQLGIGAASAPADIDWNAIHGQLRRVGATVYRSQQTAHGYCFTCLLPTADPSRNQRIEATAATEAEAIRLALARAEQWTRGK